MKIKMIKKLPRLLAIRCEMKPAEYRALQAGEAVDVNGTSAQHLITCGYVQTVKEQKKEPGRERSGGPAIESGGDK